MSYLLPHLRSGYAVDQAILTVGQRCLLARRGGRRCRACAHAWCALSPTILWPRLMQEEARVVVIRFGHDYDETCMQMDEVGAAGGAARRRRPPRHWRQGPKPLIGSPLPRRSWPPPRSR